MVHNYFFTILLVSGLVISPALGNAQEKKSPGKDSKKKSGTLIGVVTAKGPNFIEVKAFGEERARKYFPHWRGGAPKDGGGLDKKMLETFRKLKTGNRIRLTWEFEERPRAVQIEVIGKDKEKGPKKPT